MMIFLVDFDQYTYELISCVCHVLMKLFFVHPGFSPFDKHNCHHLTH